MSDERKPSEDLKEGLGMIFRAARSAAKQVDVSKIDKSLDKAITQASRVATNVGRAVADEINRMSTHKPPPWESREGGEPGGEPPAEDAGEGHVWASQAQQSEPSGGAESGTEGAAAKPADADGEAEAPKVRVDPKAE